VLTTTASVSQEGEEDALEQEDEPSGSGMHALRQSAPVSDADTRSAVVLRPDEEPGDQTGRLADVRASNKALRSELARHKADLDALKRKARAVLRLSLQASLTALFLHLRIPSSTPSFNPLMQSCSPSEIRTRRMKERRRSSHRQGDAIKHQRRRHQQTC
jgi:hypothetical protein